MKRWKRLGYEYEMVERRRGRDAIRSIAVTRSYCFFHPKKITSDHERSYVITRTGRNANTVTKNPEVDDRQIGRSHAVQPGDIRYSFAQSHALRADSRPGAARVGRAPALEKGLDILELLAVKKRPVSVPIIARELGRSVDELYRMIQVLKNRDYVARVPGSDNYKLTKRLFDLGMHQPIILALVELALPEMRQLAAATHQSSYLGVRCGSEIVVVARMESPDQWGFSIRVGSRLSPLDTAAGLVLYANQSIDMQERWEGLLPIRSSETRALRERAARIRKNGYVTLPSSLASRITDISAPVMRGELAVAALTIPFLESSQQVTTCEVAIELVRSVTERISRGLAAVPTLLSARQIRKSQKAEMCAGLRDVAEGSAESLSMCCTNSIFTRGGAKSL